MGNSQHLQEPKTIQQYKQFTNRLKTQSLKQSTYIQQLQRRCQNYQLQIKDLKRDLSQTKNKLSLLQFASIDRVRGLKQSIQLLSKDKQIKINQSVQTNVLVEKKVQKIETKLMKQMPKLQLTNVSVSSFLQNTTQTQKQQKVYIKSTKKWKDFKLHPDIIQALKVQKKTKPNHLQAEVLQTLVDDDRKKFNYLILAPFGTGKTLSCIITLMNALRPKLKCAWDKVFRGKVLQNQIFKPQGVILLQNSILQQQIQSVLKQFLQYGQKTKSQKLNFKIGRLDKQGHTYGDIIICQTKSFRNRHQRGNMNLQQCKFVVIDQIDDVYNHDKDSLQQVLLIIKNSPNTHLISCSQTHDKNFFYFYQENAGKFQINKETSNKAFNLTRINNYYVSIEGGEQTLHKYVIKRVFKALYSDTTKLKPQAILFFNSIQQINRFSQIFETIASDFTSDQSEYLKGISKGIIAAKTFKYGKKEEIKIFQMSQIIQKFRNNQTNVLIGTNIICRGLDVRNCVLRINVGVPKRNQKDDAIDVDTYRNRVRNVGRQNDKGIALTITEPQTKMPLIQGLRKVHGLQIKQLKNPQDLAKQVWECIDNNSKA